MVSSAFHPLCKSNFQIIPISGVSLEISFANDLEKPSKLEVTFSIQQQKKYNKKLQTNKNNLAIVHVILLDSISDRFKVSTKVLM